MSTDTPLDPQDAPHIHHKLGQLTRQLHDTLRELGVADGLRHAAQEIPDAKSRLTYIARLTGEAADKVLTRVEQAKQQQDHLMLKTQQIQQLASDQPDAGVTHAYLMDYLGEVSACSDQMQAHLTEIMMAQDFHDLTGQVIARVVHLASALEEQLVQLTLQTAPGSQVNQPGAGATHDLAGPVVDASNNPDVVTDQSQVDDLLASLGF